MKVGHLALGLLSLVSITFQSANAANIEDKIALQMYTVRNEGTLEQQLALAHKAGFRHVELVGDHGVSADKMKTLLANNSLTAVAAHVQLDALEQHYDQTVKFNKALGNRMVIVPWVAPENRPDSKAGWIQYAHRLDSIGKKLRNDGMQLGFHNHNFEMKKYDGETALEIIFDNTQKENLQLELDAAWASRGGQDPARLLNKYPGRVYAIHAKDNASIGVRDDEMNFAPLGEGILDWKTILPAAAASGVKWFIVEHDKPKDARSIITTSHENLRSALEAQQK
jgi:sugar phosphate isomerase/epimerase